MAGLPTVTVLLDDGTGTFPYDVSTYVRSVDGITITAGRGDEQSQAQPGTCSLTFDNTDGRFTLGSTTIDSPSPIVLNQQIRVQLTVSGTTVDRFTGYVQEWPVRWPAGGEEFSTVTITASDALARMGRVLPATPLAEAMLLDGATLVYPLTEPEPTGIAPGMVGPAVWPVGPSAATVGPINILGRTGSYPDTYPTFGSDVMPNDNGSAITFVEVETNPYPYRLGPISGGTTDTFTGPGTLMTDDWSMSFLWRATGSAGIYSGIVQLGDALSPSDNAVFGYPFASGVLRFSNYVAGSETFIESPAPLNDGEWHYITVVQTNLGKTTALYVDDDDCGTVVNASSPTGITLGAIKLGGFLSGDDPTISLGHFAFWPEAVSFPTHQALKEIALGDSGLRSDEVIERYATNADIPFTALGEGASRVPTFGGSDVLSVVNEVMNTERGRLYVDGSGTLTFEPRDYPLTTVYADTPDISIAGDLLTPDASFAVDPQQLINRAEVSRAGGPPQVREDTASITQNGVYGSQQTIQAMTDSDAANLAAYLLWLYADPGARLAGAQLDLLTQTIATQQDFLVNLLGAWLRITTLPDQAPAATVDLYIEGYTETISATAWNLSLNTAPKKAEADTWWRLDDANFPLGTNTHPFY